MGSHPINLALRFLLEIAALVAIGYWGFDQHGGFWRFVLGISGPLLAALLWGAFAVPGDPSRSGQAPVPVPGIVRLILELSLFLFATWALHNAGKTAIAALLGGITLIHYAVSYERISWLLRQKRQKAV